MRVNVQLAKLGKNIRVKASMVKQAKSKGTKVMETKVDDAPCMPCSRRRRLLQKSCCMVGASKAAPPVDDLPDLGRLSLEEAKKLADKLPQTNEGQPILTPSGGKVTRLNPYGMSDDAIARAAKVAREAEEAEKLKVALGYGKQFKYMNDAATHRASRIARI